LGVFFFFLACSAVDDDSGDDDVDDVAIGVIGRNVLRKFVTRGADDEEVGFGMVKQSEGVMPSATRSSARGRTSFMFVVVVVCV